MDRKAGDTQGIRGGGGGGCCHLGPQCSPGHWLTFAWQVAGCGKYSYLWQLWFRLDGERVVKMTMCGYCFP